MSNYDRILAIREELAWMHEQEKLHPFGVYEYARMQSLEDELDELEYAREQEALEDNCSCDISGFCSGASCPYFFTCKG